MKYSPLFWPIELKGNTIFILDETLLPDKVRYIKAKDYKQAVLAIKEMKTRAVGQVLLVMYTFLVVYNRFRKKKNFFDILVKVANEFNSARPTLSFKFLTDMVLGAYKQGLSLDKFILGFLGTLKAKRIEQAEECAQLLSDNDTVLTHCNISGLLPLIAEICLQQGKIISFIATETRPYMQGARLTTWELQQAGFEVTLITDNMVAEVMQERKVNKVIVGADNLALNGDIANKVGTYQIAILASYFNVPFYVICPPASKAETGRDIRIEVRPEKELLEICGKQIAPLGTKAYYPAFDITPNNLITKHIYLKI